jgi:hypothetical protein
MLQRISTEVAQENVFVRTLRDFQPAVIPKAFEIRNSCLVDSRISARLSRTDGYTASVSGGRADRSDLWRSEWDHDHCSWSRGSGNADTRCLRGHQWRLGRADDCRESSSSLRGSTALGRIGLIRLRADRDAWRVAVACYCVLGFCVSGHSS